MDFRTDQGVLLGCPFCGRSDTLSRATNGSGFLRCTPCYETFDPAGAMLLDDEDEEALQIQSVESNCGRCGTPLDEESRCTHCTPAERGRTQ